VEQGASGGVSSAAVKSEADASGAVSLVKIEVRIQPYQSLFDCAL